MIWISVKRISNAGRFRQSKSCAQGLIHSASAYLLVFLISQLVVSTALATTWYVRTDGGTATQCTGTTDAAYPGSGNGQACAFNHPYWALPPASQSGKSPIAGKLQPGDTLVIGSGSYMMGYGAPKLHCEQPMWYAIYLSMFYCEHSVGY